jgi:hypothetical protein
VIVESIICPWVEAEVQYLFVQNAAVNSEILSLWNGILSRWTTCRKKKGNLRHEIILKCVILYRLPLWSSGRSSWLQIRRPGFDSRHYQIFWEKKERKENGSVSGTGSTQPREYNWGATWEKSSDSCLETENTAGGIRHADHVAPSIRTSWQSLRRQTEVALSV